MGGTGEKIGLKEEKDPISLGLEGEILQFVPDTLEHPPLHFYDDQFSPLIPKIGNKIEKKGVFLDQFRTVHSTFRLFLPEIMVPVYFITLPYQFWC